MLSKKRPAVNSTDSLPVTKSITDKYHHSPQIAYMITHRVAKPTSVVYPWVCPHRTQYTVHTIPRSAEARVARVARACPLRGGEVLAPSRAPSGQSHPVLAAAGAMASADTIHALPANGPRLLRSSKLRGAPQLSSARPATCHREAGGIARSRRRLRCQRVHALID